MLEAKVDGLSVHAEMSGDLDVVVVEVAEIIGSLYAQLKVAAPEAAEVFRIGITELAKDEESPMWSMPPATSGMVCVVPTDQEGE